jgi:hypothetical protein
MYQVYYQGHHYNFPNANNPREAIRAVVEPDTHGYILQAARPGQPSSTRRFICDKLGRIYFTSEYIA